MGGALSFPGQTLVSFWEAMIHTERAKPPLSRYQRYHTAISYNKN